MSIPIAGSIGFSVAAAGLFAGSGYLGNDGRHSDQESSLALNVAGCLSVGGAAGFGVVAGRQALEARNIRSSGAVAVGVLAGVLAAAAVAEIGTMWLGKEVATSGA